MPPICKRTARRQRQESVEDHCRVSASPLVATYLATSYRVDAPSGQICLRVGKRSRQFDRWLQRQNARSWAFITAYNPASRHLPRWRNQGRQRCLRNRIGALGFVAWPGAGVGDDPTWEPEPSFLVIGIPIAEARRIARRFGQNAIVAGRTGGAPKLVWCGPRTCAGRRPSS